MLTETTGEGTTNYTYDNNGSQLTTTIGTSTTTNSYDLFGQLKSYTGMDSVVTNYSYGPDGLRVSKYSGNTTTAYVWNSGNITNEFVSVTEGQTTTTTKTGMSTASAESRRSLALRKCIISIMRMEM